MVLEAIDLYKGFRGGLGKKSFAVLRGVSFSLMRGETLGIIGDSGTGKTTLALILCGLLKPDKGSVRMDRRIQIVWQHPETAFNPRWRLCRSLKEPLRIQGVPVSPSALKEQLDRVALKGEVLHRRPGQLSGGELQRLALARALITDPDVVILDEPTSMLDALTQARIIALLGEIQETASVSFLFISHDHDLVRGFCHRRCRLKDGKLKAAEF